MKNVIRVTGVGSYLPSKILTNEDISRMVDTSDEWIQARTGIRQRHIAADGELTSDLGREAANRALAAAGVKAEDIDLLVLATATPDHTFPSTATIVQHKIGMTGGAAFDVGAVCSGFVFALSTADALMKAQGYKKALVVGAETYSRILDWSDRTTCVLFGDGAGAVVLEADTAEDDAQIGILGHNLRTDGAYKEFLYVDGGPSSTQTVGHLRMKGNQVFKHAVVNISSAVQALLEQTGVSHEDIDWFVPHQANQRILDGVAKRLSIDSSKIVSTVGKHGNTSAASVPLALSEAIDDGRVKTGDMILTEAMGGGFAWGANLFRI
ncbi:beta-ketoacyl-ACP synthase III [Ponticaulis sp.]|uniref:beta-ketoacyl-ACP synthase III n=1 Tax=Ponticaulis sp. TaxID=2020902 RepID=UPI000B70BE84|nr:beta-ketoacyl-ACP synthase III [Ponticaulis sp.]MAI92070.1 3-oxoacyl-ACP synthase [Ponticaulis sp.]OUX96245.1 MAG: 3-oxoacyl-ACP synthase [Hyphomonadaceae bacterium TMED5]|tara:strand:+ start:36371 stop:37342 length:972 start_codon:yes stop_codon:yes gene_type:complete